MCSFAEKSEKISKKGLDKSAGYAIMLLVDAGVAHPVERHLAKVEVASSSLVTRSSITPVHFGQEFLFSLRKNEKSFHKMSFPS